MEIRYLVIMYRWGNEENHSYPIGYFKTEVSAIKHGTRERNNRANKYDPKIWELQDGLPTRIVQRLPEVELVNK